MNEILHKTWLSHGEGVCSSAPSMCKECGNGLMLHKLYSVQISCFSSVTTVTLYISDNACACTRVRQSSSSLSSPNQWVCMMEEFRKQDFLYGRFALLWNAKGTSHKHSLWWWWYFRLGLRLCQDEKYKRIREWRTSNRTRTQSY